MRTAKPAAFISLPPFSGCKAIQRNTHFLSTGCTIPVLDLPRCSPTIAHDQFLQIARPRLVPQEIYALLHAHFRHRKRKDRQGAPLLFWRNPHVARTWMREIIAINCEPLHKTIQPVSLADFMALLNGWEVLPAAVNASGPHLRPLASVQ